MFKVGEVVFCPKRGIGTVEGIETRTMLNESNEYMIVHMKSPELTMMIPVDRIETSGFRALNNVEAVKEVEMILKNKEVQVDHSMDIKKRIKQNQEKLSSGSFLECGEVVRDLTCMEKIKALNNSERTILSQAKRFLVDEFASIQSLSDEQAEETIDRLLEI
nr:CarD family transcriptional regulator [uncultured Cellulosilyticum sp.]